MENNKIRVAITQGDTNGVGLELILKTFSEPDMLEICTPIIYSSQKVAAFHAKTCNLQINFNVIENAQDAHDGKINLLSCIDNEIKVELGFSSPESSLAGVLALDRAMADCNDGLADVLVCAPMESSFTNASGYKFASQVKYIELAQGSKKNAMSLYMNEQIRMAMVTDKSDLSEVVQNITAANVAQKIEELHLSLRRDFRLSNPRIAVLALNPSCNGKEENEVLIPTIDGLAEKGIQAFGPYQADTFFGDRHHEAFDGILAMYFDQAMLPVRMLSDAPCVQLLTSMPLVCALPEGDTQMDIAGQNMADPAALRNAIYVAVDTFRFRKEYDKPLGNPLPKLYHERPDSGEKLRFSIPKKKEA